MTLQQTGEASGPGLLAAPARRRTGLRIDPVVALGAVFAIWVLVPESVVRPKIGWALAGISLVLVVGSVTGHATRLRWSAPAALLLVPGTLAVLGTPRNGSATDLLHGVAATLLLAGCALLAANLDARQAHRLVTIVLGVAGVELACAAASAGLGVPAPWGHLGTPGALYGVNELVPALGGRATGTMAHSIPFGTLMAVAVMLVLFARPGLRLFARTVLAAAFAGGVVLSGSRSAAVLLVAVALLGWLWPGASRLGAPGRLVLVAAALVAAWRVHDAELDVVSSLSGTGSLTHRLGALDAAVKLFGRPTAELFLGSGDGALPVLFARGLLQEDGFTAVDDQLVTTFALAGLIGVAALLAAIVVGLVRGERGSRPAALVVVLMFLSFDVLEWRATALLFGVLVALGTARRRGDEPDPSPADR